jgi:hypothetical protein
VPRALLSAGRFFSTREGRIMAKSSWSSPLRRMRRRAVASKCLPVELSEPPDRSRARRHLPLRSSSSRGPSQAEGTHELQLLHLPPLRHVMGVLQAAGGPARRNAWRDGRVHVGD